MLFRNVRGGTEADTKPSIIIGTVGRGVRIQRLFWPVVRPRGKTPSTKQPGRIVGFFPKIVRFGLQRVGGDRTGSSGKRSKNRRRARGHDSSEAGDRRCVRIGAQGSHPRLATDGRNCAEAYQERTGTGRQNRCGAAKEVHAEGMRSRRIVRCR